ncbi:MAG: GDP-L-fucose synthase [Bacteroidales bacterium]
MDKNSKIYIAGHTGLVGSSILRNLQSKGYTNFVLKTSKQLDLTNQNETRIFFETEKPEYVFLAAAKVGGIVANNTYRADFIYENLQIQNNIIQSASKTSVKKLLFLGSSCIYPRDCAQPMKEDYLLTNPLEYTNEPYAIAKIAGIKMIESYNLQYGTNFIAVMPTNLYGPNDNFDLEKSHVLPAMIRKMHLGKCLMNNDVEEIKRDFEKNPVKSKSNNLEPIDTLATYGITPGSVELWGSGNPRREFLYADDLADACVFIMENIDFKDIVKESFGIDRIETPVKHEIRNTHINIGSGEDISIKELALIIKEIVGYRGNIIWNTGKPDGTTQKLLDVSKLNRYGWKARIGLTEGISKVYEDYRNT